MKFDYIDAFSNRPFSGNPAAVTLVERELGEEAMQLIAREINLSETAYLWKRSERFQIRWFTPAVEVDLCGHATLASAHYLWTNGVTKKDTIHFDSRSGELVAKKTQSGIELDFPLTAPFEDQELRELCKTFISSPVLWAGQSEADAVVEVPSIEHLQHLEIDLEKVKKGLNARGLLITAKDGDQYDFQSRCFFPGLGIPEDPVTGSAHCALAPYWAEKLGKKTLRARQASNRGGILELNVQAERLLISGQAVTTMRNELLV